MKIKNIVAATALAAASFATVAPANAAVIQLGFILDRSGSIGGTNWNTIVDGLSNAVGTLIPVGGTNTYEISVVSFAATASADIVRVAVTDATIRSDLATSIALLGDGRSNDVYIGGLTDYEAAFNLMRTTLQPGIAGAAFSYVNFATDGQPTDGGSCSSGCADTHDAAGIAARDALITAGIDNISIEAIGGGIDATYLRNSICYPQACDTTSPYSFPTNGFYISVANAQGYADAIGNKIKIVTEQVPEPGALALLGIGLMGLAAARRRKQAV